MSSVDKWIFIGGEESLWVNLANVSYIGENPKYVCFSGGSGKLLTPQQYDSLLEYLTAFLRVPQGL